MCRRCAVAPEVCGRTQRRPRTGNDGAGYPARVLAQPASTRGRTSRQFRAVHWPAQCEAGWNHRPGQELDWTSTHHTRQWPARLGVPSRSPTANQRGVRRSGWPLPGRPGTAIADGQPGPGQDRRPGARKRLQFWVFLRLIRQAGGKQPKLPTLREVHPCQN